MTAHLAIDVGGSHIACARVRGGVVEQRAQLEVVDPPVLHALLPPLEAALHDLRGEGAISGVALAFPGLIDPHTGRVVSTPSGKYHDAVGFDFDAWSRERLGLPILLEGDGRMALLGERGFGALVGEGDAVLLSLGTGIGTAALIGGEIVRGRSGNAAILGGHLTVAVDGPHCRCGNVGCAEVLASTWALPRLIAALTEASPLHAMTKPDLKALFELARAGDESARRIRATCLATWAAVAVNLVHAYDASCVLVTGGVAVAREVVPFMQEHVRRHVWCLGDPPAVLCGTLGADAALLGAAPLWESRYG